MARARSEVRRTRCAAWLGVLAPFAGGACGEESRAGEGVEGVEPLAGEAATHMTHRLISHNVPGSPALAIVEGIEIEVDAELKDELLFLGIPPLGHAEVEQSPVGTVPEEAESGMEVISIRGHEIRLESGELAIGEHRYGAVAPGDEVRLTPAGVRVGGELRGPLPEPR
jgi:hypothetical protein